MSKKHWIAILITCVYLLVVGFMEFPPKQPINQPVKLILPQPIIEAPKPKPAIKPTPPTVAQIERLQKDKIAKAISREYKNIDYNTAKKLVVVVYTTSRDHKLDPMLVLAIIATESRFNANAVSPKNATGYLQVIPKWHNDKIKGRNIRNMEVNISVGVKILRLCYDKHRSNRNALGCYNGATSDFAKDEYYTSVLSSKKIITRIVSKST